MKLNRMSRAKALMLVGLLGISGLSQDRVESPQEEAKQAPERKAATTRARDLSEAFRFASKEVLPAVVTILGNSKEINETLENLDLLEDDGRFDIVGSGVILDSSGLIVTNHHVVSEAKRITVRLDDGREFKGEQVRSDESSDVAILRLANPPNPLAYSKIGDSDQLSVGDWVLSVGSPFNFEQTVSAGIISGKSRVLNEQGGRSEKKFSGQLLQTDAAINPGNSGGALVNLDGELIGINTAIATRSGSFSGVGFAIPSNRVKWITSELIQRGKVRRARIGLTADPLPQVIAEELKLPLRGGIFVSRVVKDLPADKAGILVGDVIIEVAGQKIRTKNDFSAVVEQLPIDQPHFFRLIRDGSTIDLELSPIEREDRK